MLEWNYTGIQWRITLIGVILRCRYITRIHIISISICTKCTMQITIATPLELNTYIFIWFPWKENADHMWMNFIPCVLCTLMINGFSTVLVAPSNFVPILYLSHVCMDIGTQSKSWSVSNYLLYFPQEHYISYHTLELDIFYVLILLCYIWSIINPVNDIHHIHMFKLLHS